MSGTPYDSLFESAGASSGVPADVLEAVAWQESSMNPSADPNPPTDGLGLMGLTYATAQRYGYTGTRAGLLDPATNISFAAKYAAAIVADQGGLDLANFYSEYNSGSATLWQTSSQVATHVSDFLTEFASVVGVQLPDGVSIPDAVAALQGALTGSGATVGLLIVLGLMLWYRRKK